MGFVERSAQGIHCGIMAGHQDHADEMDPRSRARKGASM
jgi:hypothetical protein